MVGLKDNKMKDSGGLVIIALGILAMLVLACLFAIPVITEMMRVDAIVTPCASENYCATMVCGMGLTSTSMVETATWFPTTPPFPTNTPIP